MAAPRKSARAKVFGRVLSTTGFANVLPLLTGQIAANFLSTNGRRIRVFSRFTQMGVAIVVVFHVSIGACPNGNDGLFIGLGVTVSINFKSVNGIGVKIRQWVIVGFR